jgi:PKHD-type hydroxylase
MELSRIGLSKPMVPGKVDDESRGNPCKVKASGIAHSEAPWAFGRLYRLASWSSQYFRFRLSLIEEDLACLRYEAPEDSYGWHQDIGCGVAARRKLSATTQLSCPEDYEGGRLKLFTSGEVDPGLVGVGDTVIFPSYTPHCVTPVSRGTRLALVTWVSGPQFR